MSRKPKRDRLDAIDAESIKEVMQMRGWKLMLLRMQQVHATKVKALVSQQSEIDTATLRGFIQGLETALKIPEILIGESKKGA